MTATTHTREIGGPQPIVIGYNCMGRRRTRKGLTGIRLSMGRLTVSVVAMASGSTDIAHYTTIIADAHPVFPVCSWSRKLQSRSVRETGTQYYGMTPHHFNLGNFGKLGTWESLPEKGRRKATTLDIGSAIIPEF